MGWRDVLYPIWYDINQRFRLVQLLLQHDVTYLWALVSYFGDTLGGNQSYKSKAPKTHAGEALPWYTYPAIAYLSQLDFSQSVIFEYGAGNSSTFWAKRAKAVVSVEGDRDWYETIRAELAANQTLLFCTDRIPYAQTIRASGQLFDLIIIDAQWRYDCAIEALPCLRPGGLIILDNSDWYPQTASLLRVNGFGQIDFIGWGPINTYASCTSIFSQDFTKLARNSAPAIQVLGGIVQLATDDRPS